jgi:predicted alpha/beta superfamily hydrolase
MKRLIAIFLLLLAADSVYAQTDTAFRPLTIGLTTQIHSAFLSEDRRINIYLPIGYNPKDTARYPVIYIPDGGMEEDFLHLAGIVQYNAQPWVHCLAPSIVVGIENTNRQRDFTFPVKDLDFLKKTRFEKKDIRQYGGSGQYISFLENELQPFINSHFKTSRDASIIGESLAGLLVTEIYAKHRNMFNSYIIISPSLWWGNEQLLSEIKPDNTGTINRDIKVYIGAPNKEEDTMMYADAVKLHRTIQQKAGSRTKIFLDYLPGETHATVIHQAVFDAFRMFCGRVRPAK